MSGYFVTALVDSYLGIIDDWACATSCELSYDGILNGTTIKREENTEN